MIKVRKSRTRKLLENNLIVWSERSPTVNILTKWMNPIDITPLHLQALNMPTKWCITLVVSNENEIYTEYIQLGKRYQHIDLVDFLKDEHEKLMAEVEHPTEALWMMTTTPHELDKETLLKLGA